LQFTEPAGIFCGHKVPNLFHPSPKPEQSNPHSSITRKLKRKETLFRKLKTKGDTVQEAQNERRHCSGSGVTFTSYLLMKIM
jgi:hypothetical protein